MPPTRISTFVRRHAVFLAAIAGYGTFVFGPAVVYLTTGRAFGSDVAEYLLTARVWVGSTPTVFAYPYPLLPLLYVPLVAATPTDPLAAYRIADLLSPTLLVLAFAGVYAWLRPLVHSRGAAAVGAVVFGSFPLLLDEVGWGGQSQLLALALGFGALALLERFLPREAPLALAAAAGTALALAFLAEPYAAAFFALFVGLRLLIGFGPSVLAPGRRIWVAVTLVPVLVVGASLAAYDSRLLAYGAGPPLVLALGTPGLGAELLDRLTFGYRVLLVVYAGVVVLYLLARPELRTWTRPAQASVAAAGLSFVAIALFATSSVYADRGLYFAAAPLALLAALTLAPAAQEAKEGAGARVRTEPVSADSASASIPLHRRWLRPREFERSAVLIASAVVLLVAVQGVAAAQTYPASIGFYGLAGGTLSGLASLRGQNGSLLLISPSPTWFPVAFASGRPLLPATQPEWFITRAQVAASLLGTDLASGPAWIQAGSVAVVDAEPAWAQPSPAILMFHYPYDVELLRFSDGLLPVTLSPLVDPSVSWNVTPFYAPSVESWYTTNAIGHRYAFGLVGITKVASVLPTGTVDVALQYRFSDSLPRSIVVRLITTLPATGESRCPCAAGTAQERMAFSFRNGWVLSSFGATVSVRSSSGTPAVGFVPRDQWGDSELDIVDNPAPQANATVSLDITVAVDGAGPTTPTVVVEPGSLLAHAIRWAVVDKASSADIYARFARDPAWRLVFQNDALWLFEARAFGGS